MVEIQEEEVEDEDQAEGKVEKIQGQLVERGGGGEWASI